MYPLLLMQQNAESCCWKSQFSFILLHQGCSSRKCSQSSSVQYLRVSFAQFGKGEQQFLRLFAEDMTLFHSDTSAEHASKTVCAALNTKIDELVDLGLSIYIEKSAALHICPSAKKSNHLPSTSSILLSGTPVNVVTEMRLLGVIVDNQLSWSSQVNSVISKVSQRIGVLRRSIYQLSPSARRPSLLSVIPRDLEYAAAATIPFMSISLRDRLCSVWRRAVRCVAGRIGKQKLPPI